MREINFPKTIPTLETTHLELRAITADQASDYFAICSQEKVMRPWGTPCHESEEETAALIKTLDELFAAKQMLRWGIFEKGKSQLIGDVGYWRFLHFRLLAETGAKLHPDYWGKNYMPEALGRVIDYGFKELKLNSVEGNIDPENKASLRLVEKLGYKYIGRIEKFSYCSWRGKFVDSEHFILGHEHWNGDF